MTTGRYISLLWWLSGLPVLVLLLILPFQAVVYCIIVFAMFQVAHQASPVVLAWMNNNFRIMMYRQWHKYLLLPMLTFGFAIAVPFSWAAGIYFAWNAYHYGMQHFGVLNLCWRLGRWRVEIGIIILLITILLFVFPFIIQPNKLIAAIGLTMGFNHWIVDLGLSRRVSIRPWLFTILSVLLGLLAFVVWSPTAHGVHPRAELLVQISMGFGFVHFLYSRWIWKKENKCILGY